MYHFTSEELTKSRELIAALNRLRESLLTDRVLSETKVDWLLVLEQSAREIEHYVDALHNYVVGNGTEANLKSSFRTAKEALTLIGKYI